MKPAAQPISRRDRLITSLLLYGTWLASALIALGLLLMAFEPLPVSGERQLYGHEIATLGVVSFILLPIMRVLLMLGIFLAERDYLYALIAVLVLAIIATGTLLAI